MGKILEFNNVYLEFPEENELEEDENILTDNYDEVVATKLSLEELQRKLEETQSLHL